MIIRSGETSSALITPLPEFWYLGCNRDWSGMQRKRKPTNGHNKSKGTMQTEPRDRNNKSNTRTGPDTEIKRGGGGDLATRGPGTIVLGHKCIGCISAQTITAKAGERDKGNPHGVEGQSPNTEPSL